MFVYRSIALGLLGACCLLLAIRPPLTVIREGTGGPLVVSYGRCQPTLPPAPGPTIVDVAPGVSADQIARLIVLAPGERIATIDDVPVATELHAGAALASRELSGTRYVDIGVTSDGGSSRRVLVLLH